MRRMFLASLSVVVAIGCAEAPAPAPISASTNATDVEISIPETPGEDSQSATDAAATETLVSLNVPDMH